MQMGCGPVFGKARVYERLGQFQVEAKVVVDVYRMRRGSYIELQSFAPATQIRRCQINTGRGTALVHLGADLAL